MVNPRSIARSFVRLTRGATGSSSQRKSRRGPLAVEQLEGKVVLSGPGGSLGFAWLQREFGAFFGNGRSGHGAATSSLQQQDVRLVQGSFRALNSTFNAASSALRLTATPASGPSAAGLMTYQNTIASAISTLNLSITTDLANLPKSGGTLAATIQGQTAVLQSELDSAGTGLRSSTNRAVRALKNEGTADIDATFRQATSAILSDTTSGTITPAAIQAYNQASSSAFQTFNLAIDNAEQASISGGTTLAGASVTPAISALQASLNSAIAGLGTSFASSTFNPTAAVTTEVNNLSTSLTTIAAPTASNPFSTRLFLRTVSSTVSNARFQINQAVQTAIQGSNTSLL